MSTSRQPEKVETQNKNGQTSWFTGLTKELNQIKVFAIIALLFFVVSILLFAFSGIDYAIYAAVMSVASGVLELNRDSA